MELNQTRKLKYILISLTILLVLAIGLWWISLILRIGSGEIFLMGNERFLNMMKWEGLTFFMLLIVLLATLLKIYFEDLRKTRSVQAFFSSLTHELKTPLASLKLQAEVIQETINDSALDQKEKMQLQTYGKRLNADIAKLNNELEQVLQLAKVERNALLDIEEIDLISYLDKLKRFYPMVKLNAHNLNEVIVRLDKNAFDLIIKNLVANTLRHQPLNHEILINLEKKESSYELTYDDQGTAFTGDLTKLGKLFYKHNSPKGSGIGLYLIKKLARQMKIDIKIMAKPNLIFKFSFSETNREHAS
jgi:signal transduction histidine kinase